MGKDLQESARSVGDSSKKKGKFLFLGKQQGSERFAMSFLVRYYA